MPVINSIEATQALRNTLNLNNDAPIIVISADVSQRMQHSCNSAGITDYVSKPISSLELYEAIKNSLAQQKMK